MTPTFLSRFLCVYRDSKSKFPNRHLFNRSLMAPGRPSGTVRRVGVGIKRRGYKKGSRLTISPLLSFFLSFSLLSWTDELPPKGRENRRDVENGLSIRMTSRENVFAVVPCVIYEFEFRQRRELRIRKYRENTSTIVFHIQSSRSWKFTRHNFVLLKQKIDLKRSYSDE